MTPRYPDVVVPLDGEAHEVFNRVVLALAEANVPVTLRDQFIVEAIQDGEDPVELVRVCRRWVGEA